MSMSQKSTNKDPTKMHTTACDMPFTDFCHLCTVSEFYRPISYPCTMRFHEIFLQFSYFHTIYKYLPKTLYCWNIIIHLNVIYALQKL